MMSKDPSPVVKRSLFSWIFLGSVKLQLLLIGIICLTVGIRVLPLELQKRIVNQAINLKKVDLLILYCGFYLAAVVAANGLKFAINSIQARLGQAATAAMRSDLFAHILTLPLGFFRKTQPGMVVSAVVNELATAGDFIGMAVAVPLINVMTLVAFGAYLIWLNPLLAFLSLVIYPVGILLVVYLQRGANEANNRRVATSRQLSSRVAEAVSGVHEIQANGAFGIENAKFRRLVEQLFKIRLNWNLYRFGIKVSSNFITSFSQFLMFIVGGYLAINGRLELGALVAFLSAQEKLYDPWQELIDFYQGYQDASVSYYRTMEYFDVSPEHAEEPVGREPYALDGRVEVRDLSFATEDGITLLDGISFDLEPGQSMALVGFSGSGKSTLALCIGQLYNPTAGQVLIGGQTVSELTKKDVAANIGVVSQTPFVFDGTFDENLIYACDALSVGNGSSGASRMPGLDDKIETLQQTGVFADVLRFGLNVLLDPERHRDLVPVILRLRKSFREQFGESFSDAVEFFDPNRYLYHATIARNITFGASAREAFAETGLATNPDFLKFLDDAELTDLLLKAGENLAKATVDIVGGLPANGIFYENSPIAPHEVETYQKIVESLQRTEGVGLAAPARQGLLALALRFTPGRHKMMSLPHALEKAIMRSRSLFWKTAMGRDPGTFSISGASDYLFSQSILNNILFGKIKTAAPGVQDRINQSIVQLLIEEEILEQIVELGMQFQVGSKGDRLSGGQRQKLAIARTFLKCPRVLIMDEATSALDNRSQARIQKTLETRWKGKSTLVAVVHRLDIIKNYDKIAVLKAGRIGEIGTYDELMAAKGMLHQLVAGQA